ncbi:MAG: serine hydrolase domain-containing protein [Bacteroidota bacterium]
MYHQYQLFLALFIGLQSAIAQSNQNKQKIDSIFARYNSNTPGVAVGILKNGEFVFKKGYGASNLEYNHLIFENTVFHIASLSKQFTAFAIHLLESDGLVSLEDDVHEYLPELPRYDQVIKVKHLLAHTSGLREQFALLTLAGWNMTDNITKNQILKLAFAQTELNFAPGSKLSYCNTGYTLLAEIIERITGFTLHEFCNKRIFKPLDMQNTQFYEDNTSIVKNRAYSYEIKNEIYVKKRLNFSFAGATSLFTTIEDLAKWANNFDNPIIGSEELIKKFNTPSKLNNNELAIWKVIDQDTLYHAKGQFIRNYKGVTVYKHGGHDAGYRTFLARFPDEDLTIITLSNDEHYEIFARGMEIAEIYLEDKLVERTKPSKDKPNPTNKEEQYEENHLTPYIGSYRSAELDTRYHIVEKENALVVQHQRLEDIKLKPVAKNRFSGTNSYWLFEIEFTGSRERITGFNISNFGVKNLSFTKEE